MKLKVDLTLGHFEAEGDDETVKELYLHFMENHKYRGNINSDAANEEKGLESELNFPTVPVATTPEKKKKIQKKSSSQRIYKMSSEITDNPLSKGLKKFHDGFILSSNEQRVTLFVYFLSKNMNIPMVTEDHIYTCFNLVAVKKPTVLNQQIRNAKQKGWLNHDDWQDIKVTSPGENLIEHDLAKSQN